LDAYGTYLLFVAGMLVIMILVVMRYRHRKRMAELNTVDDDLAYQVPIGYCCKHFPMP